MPVAAVESLLSAVGGRRVGLVTGPTGWLGADGHLADLLHARGLLSALFAPEHGVWGDLQAGEHVPDAVDPRTGTRAPSLTPGAPRWRAACAPVPTAARR
jgi:uncharacterized protein YbbC (DUF1343 family)